MKRKVNIGMIVVFVLFLTLPYVFAHRDRNGRVSQMENRTLAAYPSVFNQEDGWNKNYRSEFEAWLNDNLRGRTIMMEVNSTLQYTLFERIVKSDTIQGRNHWLFVNDEDMIKEYQRLNLPMEKELEQYADNMQGIADYLKERDIQFYYFQCYSKEEIYPEMYVPGINRVGGKTSRADRLVEILQERTDVNQILTKENLLEHKDELIYYQFVDLLHWNEKGSYYGYQSLLERIHKDFEEIPVLQEADFSVTWVETTADIYGFTYPEVELCPIYTPVNSHAVEITQDTKERWDFLHYKEHTHDFVNEDCVNDLKILLVGDSFVRMFLKNDIAESFCATLSIDRLNIPILDEVVAEYEPDIVVIECAQSAVKETMELFDQAQYIQ